MAKNCLNKLSDGVLQGCAITPVGVKEIYLMHAGDVKFEYGLAPNRIYSAKFAEGAKSYKVEGYKQNIQVNGSLKSLDASAALDASVTFKVQYGTKVTDFVRAITVGKFHVLVIYNSGQQAILGSTVPLECSAVDFDSNANAAMVTLTLSTPEGAAGCPMVVSYSPASDLIISKAN